MASIQPKNTIRPYPTHNIKFQKNSKKIKKNTIMGSFQCKIRRRRERKTEYKNYCSDPFLPDP